ncbi:MAG: hypothetical protein KF764_33120, partial [Labilithrix sp.]|nr:hypothetical protein [Labilithrix sp.]
MRRIHAVLAASSFVVALIAACGTDGGSLFTGGDGTGDGGDQSSGSPPGFSPGEGGVDLDGQASPIAITPADQTLTYVSGQPAPTLTF